MGKKTVFGKSGKKNVRSSQDKDLKPENTLPNMMMAASWCVAILHWRLG